MFWLRVVSLAGVLPWTLAYTSLSDASLRSIPDPGTDFDIHDGAILAPILVPRVPGTPGSAAVRAHFADFFQNSLSNWTVTYQNSTFTTPTSNGEQVPFVNLIATRDPPWASEGSVGRLALVAHYDSKLTPEGFIGATDSAAPCAMILHAARSIDQALTEKWASMDADFAGLDDVEENRGIQIILLDGEEAFAVWTDTDSLYGARSLAETWETTYNPASSTYQSPLDSIDLFVLLDLLGAAKPNVPSYYKTTHWAYKSMAEAETRLRSLGLLKTLGRKFLAEQNKLDTDRWMGGLIGDDHVPFMKRGVEILHLIAYPFPSVWHKMEDDGEHLDIDTVSDWAKIVTAFAAEWLDLDNFMTKGQQVNAPDDSHEGTSLGAAARDEL